MADFLFVWTVCAMSTVVWLLLSETLLVMLRGAAYYMRLKEALGEPQVTSWVRSTVQLLLFWWAFLLIWIWAAWNKRGFLEHMIWVKEDTERLKRKRRERELASVQKGLEELSRKLAKQGVNVTFEIGEAPQSTDPPNWTFSTQVNGGEPRVVETTDPEEAVDLLVSSLHLTRALPQDEDDSEEEN